MNRFISLLLISFSLLFLLSIYASANDKPRSYEEIYPEVGYTTVEDAVNEFEQHFKQKLKLPLRVPPISFTHQFGRFNDLDGDSNDSLEVIFINEKVSENHYQIIVRPIMNKIPIKEEYVLKTFELKNGIKATYMTISGFNALVFESGDWQYMLNIDKRASNKITPETLLDIANSIDY